MLNNRRYTKHIWDNLRYDTPIQEVKHPENNEKEAWKKWCASKELRDYCAWEAFMSLHSHPERIISSESFRVVSKESNIQELR